MQIGQCRRGKPGSGTLIGARRCEVFMALRRTAALTQEAGMKSRLLHEDDGQRTFALVFETGDELMGQLERFASQERLAGAQFT
jgi:hypothetical protein